MSTRAKIVALICVVAFLVLLLATAGLFSPVVIESVRKAFDESAKLFAAAQAQPQSQFVPVIIGAFLAATLALLFNTVLEYVKRRIAKEPLLDLFITDLAAMALDVQRSSLSRFDDGITVNVRGVRGVKFRSDAQEVIFEAYNVKLYEAEGFKLAATLNSDTRRHFWKTYKSLREVEATRLALKALPSDDAHRESMHVLYAGLNKELYPKLVELVNLLNEERFILRRPFAPLT